MDNGAPRLVRLERLVNQLWRAITDLGKRLSAQEQQMWQAFSYLGSSGGGGSSGDIRIWLPTGIAAGTFGTPGTATDAIIAVRSGNGYTISGGVTGQTVYNCDTTAIVGAKAAWAAWRDDSTLELKIGDC